MDFQHEAEMQEPVRRWLQRQGLDIKSEFSTPWGVCDFVAVAFREANVAKRLARGQKSAIGPSSRVAVLHAIPDREQLTFATFKGLSRRFEPVMDVARLHDELAQLLGAGFIVSPRRNAFQRVNGWLPLHERILAVELKLTRVSEAVSQATAHFAFAPEAFVALPRALAERVARDERRVRFAMTGLGLLAVGRRNCTVLVPPAGKQEAIEPVLQLSFLERFWKSHVTSSSS